MPETTSSNFIPDAVRADLAEGRFSKVITRFPPEPNGYLHIGHAKAICIDFGIAQEFGGACNLRFDDTNPTKEEQEYIDAIQDGVRWLGFDWGSHLYYASDYFDRMYEWAIQLIKAGKAYVDDQTADQIRDNRRHADGTGNTSPYRDRSIEENLALFERMQAGEFPDGSRVLRAKIDMASPNLNMRDPVMYRILAAPHHRTGDRWKIYPMYDWAHGLEDSIEEISHSLCSLEFEDHRPLYDWFLEQLGIHHPRQIEFARLELNYTIMSKRKLLQLVEAKLVSGWDDPRLPTLAGLRRRGFTPESIRDFCERIGVAKANSVVDYALAGALPARGSQQARPAVHGRPAAAQGRADQLSGRANRRSGGGHKSRRSCRREEERSRSAASSGLSRTIFAKIRPRNSFACRRAAKCG